MSIKSWNIVLVLALIIAISCGGLILYKNHEQKQAEIAQASAEEERIAEAKRQKAEKQAALMQSFEDFLNDFLSDIDTQVREYKQSRAVMSELLKPKNLSTPEYIAENARLAESTLMSLQLQMDDIMKRFDKADENIRTLVEQLNEKGQLNVQDTWNAMRDENTQSFTAFFTSDQDLLTAQLKLIEFYQDHAQDLQVDIENSRILFDDVVLQEKEALLRAAIIEIKAMQKDLLKPEDQNHSNAKENPEQKNP